MRNRPFKKLLRRVKSGAKGAARPEPPPKPPPARFSEVAESEGVARSRPARGRVKPPAEERHEAAPARPLADHAFHVVCDGPRGIEGHRDDVDPTALAWLARQDPAASLDLHGLAAEEARRRLHRFIRARAARGHEVVLVVTGKGTRGGGVLRSEAPGWLTEASIAPFVRAFATAPPLHGGLGAILLLLALSVPK